MIRVDALRRVLRLGPTDWPPDNSDLTQARKEFIALVDVALDHIFVDGIAPEMLYAHEHMDDAMWGIG